MVTIQELRKQLGMSQKQFADYLEIPVGTIRNWEQGRRVPPDYVTNLITKVIAEKRMSDIIESFKEEEEEYDR